MPTTRLLVASLFAAVATGMAAAHFPFIVPEADGATALLVMSESLEADDAVKLALLADARLALRDGRGGEWPIAAPSRESGESSLRLTLAGEGTRVVSGVIDLGVMQRGSTPHVLIYHPKTIVGDAVASSTDLGAEVPIEIVPVRTQRGVVLRLEFGGEPAANAPITVVRPGAADVELVTDARGETAVVEPGRIGAWARRWVPGTGEREGKSFKETRHYATLVADLPGDAAAPATVKPRSDNGVPVARLPRAIASFGAAVVDGWLYVYGGHAGARHDYSTATVSGRFSRARIDDLLSGAGPWEELAGGPSLQGMNLVAYRDTIVRVGGMEPRNAPGEPADNHSIVDVAMYQPRERRWISLPPLPEPRSSHDVVVAGDWLVVLGGWSMHGAGTETTWLDDTLMLDLDAVTAGSESAEWQRVPQPFRRRALIAAVLDGAVYAIGGFDEHDVPHTDVDVLNLATRTWSKGPALPGSSRNGFAPAACIADGRLHVSVATGELFRLATDGTAWEIAATATPRIVHRLVAHGDEVLVLGGARDAVMTDLIESIALRGPDRTPRSAIVAEPTESLSDTAAEAIAVAMESIDATYDRLRRAENVHWSTLADEPETDVAALAAELVRHLQALPVEDGGVPASFRAMHATSVERAVAFERLATAIPREASALSAQLGLIRASCTECHRAFR